MKEMRWEETLMRNDCGLRVDDESESEYDRSWKMSRVKKGFGYVPLPSSVSSDERFIY